MLRFQTEDDSQTGEKVLTCYLLPQQPPPSLGRLLATGSWELGWGWGMVSDEWGSLMCVSLRGIRAAEQPFGELERCSAQPHQRHPVSGGSRVQR